MTPAAGRASVTAEQAAELLGVRLQTVYAYVSRGLLARDVRRDDSGRRVSGFDREEVLRLAAARSRPRTGTLDVFVETDVSTLDPRGRLAFRGVPVGELLGRRVEDVAELLWSADGRLGAGATWRLEADRRVAAQVAAASLSPGATDPDRLRAAVVALAGTDPDRADLGRAHVAAVGRIAVQAGVEALPLRWSSPDDEADLEVRLWPRLTAAPPTPDGLEALRAALVLLLDHELAASTMAVRVAAGTGADPWLLLLTGLAALGGPRHGGASREAARLLQRCVDGGGDEAAVAAAVSSYGDLGGPPGFGHLVYTDADPRAEALLDRVARLDPDGWAVVERLLLHVAREPGLSPNVDLGLAALSRACGFVDGAGETIFALARQVGWLAHALEEGPHGLRFRGRAAPSA